MLGLTAKPTYFLPTSTGGAERKAI